MRAIRALDLIPEPSDPYWCGVRRMAQRLGTDGCTWVPDWYVEACWEHDIHWRTGLTLWNQPITFAQANRRFRLVIQSRSPFGQFSPMSWWRFAAVTLAWWGRAATARLKRLARRAWQGRRASSTTKPPAASSEKPGA